MDPLIIPIVGLAIPMAVVPVALRAKQARRERELEHIERMQALQLGRTLPRDKPWWTPGRLGLAIAVAVPVSVFASAAIATAADGYHSGVWIAAGLVGWLGVEKGSSLARRGAVEPACTEKPLVEDDAFDVVGARG